MACRGHRHVESVGELGCVQWSRKVDGGRRSDLGVSLAQSRPRVQSNAQRTPRTVASCRGRVEQREVVVFIDRMGPPSRMGRPHGGEVVDLLESNYLVGVNVDDSSRCLEASLGHSLVAAGRGH